MDTTTVRAGANKGLQSERGPAALTLGFQTSTGDRRIPQTTAMGLSDKINQFTSLRKRTSTAAVMPTAACTLTHNDTPLLVFVC
jgi:ABC-type amino acid transport system permease subunit